jgi:chaperone required for assembly of F1-ATPase
VQRGFKEPGEKPRRFYKAVEIAPGEGGFVVLLDGRAVRTPGGARLALPTAAAAEQVAEEWAAQGEFIEMGAMHAQRLANTAIDAIPAAREATADSVASFAASDLLCYRAEAPEGLARRQAERWVELGLDFVCVDGIIHRPQPDATLARVRSYALGLDDFRLAGLAFGTALFGSAVLGLAVTRGWLSAEAAFDLSRLDEAWQEEQWGVDAEAADRTARLADEARMLGRWFAALD